MKPKTGKVKSTKKSVPKNKHPNWEMIGYMVLGFLITCFFSYLFYDHYLPALFALPLFYPFRRLLQKKLLERERRKLNLQFKDALSSLAASLHTGYAVENAMREARKEMVLLYGSDAVMVGELSEMLRQMGIGKTVEDVWDAFAARSGIEDVANFAQVFRIAKRNSGGLVSIIDVTAETIGDKIDTEREIQTILQAKRYEQMIMNVVPLLMILYMRMGNGEFMSVLYTSWLGRGLMTGCLIVYLVAYKIAEKIVSVRV
jgi:tight adherence protein B